MEKNKFDKSKAKKVIFVVSLVLNALFALLLLVTFTVAGCSPKKSEDSSLRNETRVLNGVTRKNAISTLQTGVNYVFDDFPSVDEDFEDTFVFEDYDPTTGEEGNTYSYMAGAIDGYGGGIPDLTYGASSEPADSASVWDGVDGWYEPQFAYIRFYSLPDDSATISFLKANLSLADVQPETSSEPEQSSSQPDVPPSSDVLLSAGYYAFNSSFSYGGVANADMSFVDSGTRYYVGLKLLQTGVVFVKPDSTDVYVWTPAGGWADDSYKSIRLLSDSTVSSTFANFFYDSVTPNSGVFSDYYTSNGFLVGGSGYGYRFTALPSSNALSGFSSMTFNTYGVAETDDGVFISFTSLSYNASTGYLQAVNSNASPVIYEVSHSSSYSNLGLAIFDWSSVPADFRLLLALASIGYRGSSLSYVGSPNANVVGGSYRLNETLVGGIGAVNSSTGTNDVSIFYDSVSVGALSFVGLRISSNDSGTVTMWGLSANGSSTELYLSSSRYVDSSYRDVVFGSTFYGVVNNNASDGVIVPVADGVNDLNGWLNINSSNVIDSIAPSVGVLTLASDYTGAEIIGTSVSNSALVVPQSGYPASNDDIDVVIRGVVFESMGLTFNRVTLKYSSIPSADANGYVYYQAIDDNHSIVNRSFRGDDAMLRYSHVLVSMDYSFYDGDSLQYTVKAMTRNVVYFGSSGASTYSLIPTWANNDARVLRVVSNAGIKGLSLYQPSLDGFQLLALGNSIGAVYSDVTISVYDMIGNAFDSVAGIFNLMILPGISLGILVFIPLVITMIAFIIKLLQK